MTCIQIREGNSNIAGCWNPLVLRLLSVNNFFQNLAQSDSNALGIGYLLPSLHEEGSSRSHAQTRCNALNLVERNC
jgi:hypothetical protein